MFPYIVCKTVGFFSRNRDMPRNTKGETPPTILLIELSHERSFEMLKAVIVK